MDLIKSQMPDEDIQALVDALQKHSEGTSLVSWHTKRNK